MPNFRFSTNELRRGVREALLAEAERAFLGMRDISHFLPGECQKRTPVLYGFLTAGVHGVVVRYRRSYAAVMYVAANDPSSEYAIPMHEDEYNPGEKSRAKQRRTGKFAGRKYMTRALDENREKIILILQRRLYQ